MDNIEPSFFKKLTGDKLELKKIKKAILTQSLLSKSKTEKHLMMLLNKYGKVVKNDVQENVDFQQAFFLADNWNYYQFKNADMQKLKKWIKTGLINVSTGELIINKETWSWLVSIAYLKATSKESPNHYFLKYLLELYFKKNYVGWELKKELSAKVFSEKIRYDLYLQNEKRVIVGEVGGVQIWKVMTALEQGADVLIAPHWTTEKKYSLTTYKTKYKFYYFKNISIGRRDRR